MQADENVAADEDRLGNDQRDCTAAERGQMITLMVLIFFALVFYTLFEQTYGSWVVFTDRILTMIGGLTK